MEYGDGGVVGVDEPAKLGAVLEGEEDFLDNSRGALFGGENFDRRVGGEVEAVLDFAVFVSWDVAPLEDGDVWDEGAIGESAAEFGEGVSAFFGLGDAVDFSSEAALQGAVFALGHWFGLDVPVDIFAGGFGFWEFQEFSKGIALGGGDRHDSSGTLLFCQL